MLFLAGLVVIFLSEGSVVLVFESVSDRDCLLVQFYYGAQGDV